MKIEAGNFTVSCRDIYNEPTVMNGVSVRRLRLELDAPLTEEEVAALSENPWTLYEEDGSVASVQTGFSHFEGYCVSFARVEEAESLKMQLESVSHELAQKKQEIQVREAQFDGLVRLMKETGMAENDLYIELAKGNATPMPLPTFTLPVSSKKG